MAVTARFLPSSQLSVLGRCSRQHTHDQSERCREYFGQWRRRARPGRPSDRREHGLIQVFGLGGNDTITFNEANGALPAARAVRRSWQ